MITLDDLMAKPSQSATADPKKRYKEYVIEMQSKGEEPLTFPEWYKLNQ